MATSDASSFHTVREWQHLLIGEGELAPGPARQLHTLAKRITRRLRVPQPVLKRTVDPQTTRPSLRAGQVVGVLTVPGTSVEILPKIGSEDDDRVRKALTRMLSVAWSLPVADSELTELATQREDLLEILIRLFANRLLAAVRRGLPHRYRLREDDLPILRGKFNVRRQLARHIFRTARLACRFDELSVDTPLNRVLKAATTRLASITRSAANARILAELTARFEFVGNSSDPMREPVMLDRTNDSFHRLHGMARRFLGEDWQSTTTGESAGFALLFPMNDLFEEFVGRSLRSALSHNPRKRVRLQSTGKYALDGSREGEHLFALRPDIVVEDRDAGGKIIIDTKWKELTPEGPEDGVARDDVYQILAYARAYKAQRVVLLYPWHEGLTEGIHRSWRVAGTSTVFDIATVNIGSPKSIPGVLRGIVDHPIRQGLSGESVPVLSRESGLPAMGA